MSHTVRDKKRLLARVRRIRGQIEAAEHALERESGCADVLQLLASIRGATNGLMGEVLEEHIRSHVAASDLEPAQRQEGADDVIELVRTYLK